MGFVYRVRGGMEMCKNVFRECEENIPEMGAIVGGMLNWHSLATTCEINVLYKYDIYYSIVNRCTFSCIVSVKSQWFALFIIL